MINPAADNNALTKSDNENIFPINFQPIPKRFMVWDKRANEFKYNFNGSKIFSLIDISVFVINRSVWGEPYDELEFVQSTNLFGKDGNEILEGGILEDDEGRLSYARRYQGSWVAYPINYQVSILPNIYECGHKLKLVGHIFSNPELLEEK